MGNLFSRATAEDSGAAAPERAEDAAAVAEAVAQPEAETEAAAAATEANTDTAADTTAADTAETAAAEADRAEEDADDPVHADTGASLAGSDGEDDDDGERGEGDDADRDVEGDDSSAMLASDDEQDEALPSSHEQAREPDQPPPSQQQEPPPQQEPQQPPGDEQQPQQPHPHGGSKQQSLPPQPMDIVETNGDSDDLFSSDDSDSDADDGAAPGVSLLKEDAFLIDGHIVKRSSLAPLRILGKGETCVVSEVSCPVTGRIFALKSMSIEETHDAEGVVEMTGVTSRVVNTEVQALRALASCPFACKLVGQTQDAENVHLLMECYQCDLFCVMDQAENRSSVLPSMQIQCDQPQLQYN